MRLRILAASTMLTLAITATALAAHPIAGGHYKGVDSAPKVNGFRSPVTFTAASGSKLVHFKYSTFGCFGSGGGHLTPGVNYHLRPYAVQTVDTINVAGNGKFSVRNASSTYKIDGQTTVTKSSVSGEFTRSNKATGTISFTQTFSEPHFASAHCRPTVPTFGATH
jgi:hypothetical protein